VIILIVEDEPIIALNLALTLEDAGHTILGPVRSSREALELARKTHPELALVDINLEGRQEGTDLARALRRLGTPSIFLSAQHAVAYANSDAAIGLIGKPYTAEAVCDSLLMVDDIIHGREVGEDENTGMLELFRHEDRATRVS
jgi:DNA-binding response OmpR family regulator